MNYWLMKSEPEAFSIDNLKNSPKSISAWDGVRNYQARNMLRDQMQVGDQAFFYHSSCNPPGIAGIMEIVKSGYPDHTAFDPTSHHFDPKSNPDKPQWYMVDVHFIKKFSALIPLAILKQIPQLRKMKILQKGNRLSITPVTLQEWKTIVNLEKDS